MISAPLIAEWLERYKARNDLSWNQLARHLAASSDIDMQTWRRWFMRLRSQRHATVGMADLACCIMGEHISRFETFKQEAS